MPARSSSATRRASWSRAISPCAPMGPTRRQGHQRADQRLRGHRPRPAAHPAREVGVAAGFPNSSAAARRRQLFRAPRRTGQGGRGSDRRRCGRARRRQVAPLLRVQDRGQRRLDRARGIFGVARQGLGLSCRSSSCCTAISAFAGDDDAAARREKVATKIGRLDPELENALPYLAALLEFGDDKERLAGMDAQLRRSRTLEAVVAPCCSARPSSIP